MMADLKADKYYDLRCDFCFLMWSTDFDGGRGMFTNREALLRSARKAGWGVKNGKNACPICGRKHSGKHKADLEEE